MQPIVTKSIDLYGSDMSKATRQQLTELICHCAIELDSRHAIRRVNGQTEQIADALLESSDEALLTIIIAAGIKLRIPYTTQDLTTIAA